MRLNGKNVRPALLITLGAPYFQVLCDGLLFYGQTTAISKTRYYAWKICKIWWKVIAGRICWWDEIEWQKCAPSVINNVGRTPKSPTCVGLVVHDQILNSGPRPHRRPGNTTLQKNNDDNTYFIITQTYSCAICSIFFQVMDTFSNIEMLCTYISLSSLRS